MSNAAKVESKLTRRQLLRRGAYSTIGALGIYAFGIEPRWVAVENRDLPIRRLPVDLVGKTAIQISDLHLGSRVGESWLRSQFEFIESLQPDFVFFTGDYIDDGSEWHVDLGCKLLSHFPKGKLGTACVLGNHDHGTSQTHARINRQNTERLVRGFAESGIHLLRDQAIDLGGLKIGGLRDLWLGGFDFETARQTILDVTDQPAIVLSHNPDSVDLPIWKGYDNWILCGHTHGGQCCFPIIGAPIVPVDNKNYVAGKYEIDGGHRMYISRGVGHTRRVRFMARPEITVFTLQADLA